MRHRLNLACRFVIAAGLAALAIATLPAAAEQVLRRPNSAEPESLDPQKITGQSEATVIWDLFEPLITLDADRRPVPGAARSWDISADQKTWTFHLRPGSSWSDGTPLTAEDWVYSFRRLVDPATGATDLETRRAALEAAERTVLADYALPPLQFGVSNALVNPRLVGRRDTLPYPQTRYLSFKD
jgi:ABC-type oligopeptide transport system substrate-binding subunit